LPLSFTLFLCSFFHNCALSSTPTAKQRTHINLSTRIIYSYKKIRNLSNSTVQDITKKISIYTETDIQRLMNFPQNYRHWVYFFQSCVVVIPEVEFPSSDYCYLHFGKHLIAITCYHTAIGLRVYGSLLRNFLRSLDI